MNIYLKQDIESWLKAQVAKGRFSSMDEALSVAVDLMRLEDIEHGEDQCVLKENIKWHKEVEVRIRELLNLDDQWDGYKAGAVDFWTANFALSMLNSICNSNTPTPSIVPGVDGDLQIEWHIGDVDLELHVIAPNNVEAWMGTPENEMEEEIHLTDNFQIVKEWIDKLPEPAGAQNAGSA